MFVKFAGLYLHTVTETKLVVDTSRGGKLHINVKSVKISLYSNNWNLDFLYTILSVLYPSVAFLEAIIISMENLVIVFKEASLVWLMILALCA